ncbi:carboxypeptidase-like regulatory domain-containing protein [Flagellimonas sp.]|uniref:carboxypeptidase-like regulatory domain-containing protein n=1 Tax=Flagellimonas sp. TaxID=2058762 RepID=UPI003F4A6343
MKNTLFSITFIFVLLTFCSVIAQENSQIVSGQVTHLGKPLSGAKVSVLETGASALTDDKGRYNIRVRVKNTLKYEYPGLRSVEVIVEDVTRILYVAMEPEINKLDEVVVTEKKMKRQDSLELQYRYGTGVVKGAYGFVEKRTSALSMRIFEEEEIQRSFELLDVIRKAAPGIQVAGGPSQFFLLLSPRFSNRPSQGLPFTPAGFDIDGSLSYEIPFFLPVHQIKRIAVIRTPQYGGYGRFGVGGLVIINTKTGEFVKPSENGEAYDFAKLRNNVYKGDAKPHSTLNQDTSEYGSLLRNTKNREEALSIFEERVKIFGNSPDFYFDTASFFLDELQDRKTYVLLLQKTKKRFADNANVLKAIAYRYEELGDLDAANDMYVKIFKLRPSYGQSYRDLANNYKKNGDEKMALELVSRYKKAIADFDILEDESAQSEIDSILSTEATSWVNTEKVQLKKKLKKDLKSEVWPIRLMVEWNNSDAEFDLQLVNPQGHYYTWSHTLEKNAEFIQEEKIRGFSSKQFYIGTTPPGQWQVNVKYYGNKSFDDTYLKVTAYTNYGSQIQTQNVQVYKLSTKNVNQELMKIATPSRTVLTSN